MMVDVASAACFSAFAIWQASKPSWAAVPLALLAIFWVLAVYRDAGSSRIDGVTVAIARSGVALYAMAWFFALLVASPSHFGFWIVMLGVLVIGAPPLLIVARRAGPEKVSDTAGVRHPSVDGDR